MIGKKIKEIVDLSEKSVSEIAKELNTTPQNIYRIFKKDNVQMDVLIQFANALNTSVSEFLKDDPTVKRLNNIEERITKYEESLEKKNNLIKELNEKIKQMEHELKLTHELLNLYELSGAKEFVIESIKNKAEKAGAKDKAWKDFEKGKQKGE